MSELKSPHYFLRYFLSLIVTILLFILIFTITSSVAYYTYQTVSFQNNAIQEDIQELDLILNELSCDSELLFESSKKLEDSGIKISILEESFGENDERVLEQKKLYSELEIKHFEIVNQLNNRCDVEFITILFFYSNLDPFADPSAYMGYILSMFKYENPFRVMIYSFDIDLNSESIKDIKETYNITGVPITVINGEDLVYVSNLRDLEEYLDSPFLAP